MQVKRRCCNATALQLCYWSVYLERLFGLTVFFNRARTMTCFCLGEKDNIPQGCIEKTADNCNGNVVSRLH